MVSLVIIHRKDRARPIVVREYLDEVYRPPFKITTLLLWLATRFLADRGGREGRPLRT